MKTIATFALGLVLLFPSFTFAATTQEQYQSTLRQLIALLEQKIAVLEAELKAQQTTAPQKASTPAVPSECDNTKAARSALEQSFTQTTYDYTQNKAANPNNSDIFYAYQKAKQDFAAKEYQAQLNESSACGYPFKLEPFIPSR